MIVLPSGIKFSAFLFDCDGTIGNSMPLHYRAWNLALKGYGLRFEKQRFLDLAGMSTLEIVRLLSQEHSVNLNAQEVNYQREQAYLELLPQVDFVPGILDHIESGSGRLPMAVVSGSPRESVVKTLKALKIEHHFEVLVCAEDCKRGKPHPEGYLKAAKLLAVKPDKHCLVFEDADLGIEAATAAGMSWVRVPAAPIED